MAGIRETEGQGEARREGMGIRERVRDGEISMRHVKVVANQRFRELGERDNGLLPPRTSRQSSWRSCRQVARVEGKGAVGGGECNMTC